MFTARVPRWRWHVFGESRSQENTLLRHGSLEWICAEAIVPVYQPIVEIGTGRPIGFEVLARWAGTANHTVSPLEFIPFLAANGLLSRLTKQLLGQACREAAGWPEHLTLAINIAPAQLLEAGLPALIREATEPTGFALSRLEVEITEEPLQGPLAQAQATAAALRDMGTALVMDDYGKGASDQRRLHQLPFSRLKLDMSLTQMIEENPDSWRSARTAIRMAASSGMSVVAEGVETELQAEVLEQLRCPAGQGWLFGAPAPAHELGRFLTQEGPARLRAPYIAASVADLLLGPPGARLTAAEFSPSLPIREGAQEGNREIGKNPDVA